MVPCVLTVRRIERLSVLAYQLSLGSDAVAELKLGGFEVVTDRLEGSRALVIGQLWLVAGVCEVNLWLSGDYLQPTSSTQYTTARQHRHQHRLCASFCRYWVYIHDDSKCGSGLLERCPRWLFFLASNMHKSIFGRVRGGPRAETLWRPRPSRLVAPRFWHSSLKLLAMAKSFNLLWGHRGGWQKCEIIPRRWSRLTQIPPTLGVSFYCQQTIVKLVNNKNSKTSG